MRIGIIGIAGRVSSEVIKLASSYEDLKIIGGTVSPERLNEIDIIRKHFVNYKVAVSLAEIINDIDVIIDFSIPKASTDALAIAAKNHKAYVLGTTGFNVEEKENLKIFAKKMPLLYSTNMSLGMNLIFKLIRSLNHIPNEFKTGIVDIHHIYKKDSPSGTSISLKSLLSSKAKHQQDIPISSMRLGECYGSHEILFNSCSEEIKISHNAKNRAIFAEGAIKAAKWLIHKPNGLYSMQDILDE